MRRRVLARPARELADEQAREHDSEGLAGGAAEKTSTTSAVAPPLEPPRNRRAVALAEDPEELVADVKALVGGGGGIDEAVLDAALRAWSANTRRAFRSDLK